jgi:hypothetical protein
MVYPFFQKWKALQTAVFSIKPEIEQAEKVYREKVVLWQEIFRELNIGTPVYSLRKQAELLAQLYMGKPAEAYSRMKDKIQQVSEFKLLSSSEVDVFYDLVLKLEEESKKEQSVAGTILNEILAGRVPEKSSMYALQDIIKHESIFLRIEDKEFQAIENHFLLSKMPGAGRAEYLHIFTAVKEGVVMFKDSQFWFGDKLIQGVIVKDNTIIIKGDHYTLMQNAKWITQDTFVVPSLRDPYSYFVSRGHFEGKSRAEIQKILGIQNAEAVVTLEVRILPEQLFIRVQKGQPVKFAIARLMPEQVIRVIRSAQLVA